MDLVLFVLALACLSPAPRPGQSAEPKPPAQSYAGLPNVTGYDVNELKASLGPPVVTTRPKNGVVTWSYATPDGDRLVYLVGGIAAMKPPKKDARPDPPGCRAALETNTVSVIATGTPLYSAPRIRAEALDRVAAGVALNVQGVSGTWYAVNLPRRPGAGYVHCSDVRPAAR